MRIIYTRNPLLTKRIDKVKQIIAHNCGKPKWHSFTLKREIWGVLTLSHKLCPRKQTTESKLVILVSFSQKLPHTLIPVIASTYCGMYAVTFFFWATLYRWLCQAEWLFFMRQNNVYMWEWVPPPPPPPPPQKKKKKCYFVC